MNAAPENSRSPEGRSVDQVVAILWETAVESFIRAILVVVFGSIAIGIASPILGEMVPSRPPGFEPELEAKTTPTVDRTHGEEHFTQHRFLIVFSLIFVLTAGFRLLRPQQSGQWPVVERHASRITQHVAENWFRLIVGNAFGALISAIVLVWVQRFTIPNLLFHEVLELVMGGLHRLAGALLGVGQSDTLAAWFNWCGDNQLRFIFWFFYLSAICDDLGIPNFKTLGLWVLRRIRRRVLRQVA